MSTLQMSPLKNSVLTFDRIIEEIKRNHSNLIESYENYSILSVPMYLNKQLQKPPYSTTEDLKNELEKTLKETEDKEIRRHCEGLLVRQREYENLGTIVVAKSPTPKNRDWNKIQSWRFEEFDKLRALDKIMVSFRGRMLCGNDLRGNNDSNYVKSPYITPAYAFETPSGWDLIRVTF